MSDLNREIAERMRGIRDLSDLSVSELAGRIGLTGQELEKYESGEVEIPVSVLHDISVKLNISMTELLTGEAAKLSVYALVRGGKGVGIDRRDAYKYKDLAYNFAGRKLEPFLVTVDPKPDADPYHLNTHTGHEYHYVLEGSMNIMIDRHELTLNEGDSVYFDSTYEHGMKALCGKPVRLLVIIV